MQRLHAHRPAIHPPVPRAEDVASAYDDAGGDYLAYADGDPRRLFAFDGPHAYADRRLWAVLAARLDELRAKGADAVSLLDAGCGPGTWLRRMVTYARDLGFSRITARGFDLSRGQIRLATRMALDLAGEPGVALTFEVADLTDRLPEADASIDITLCLYSVLSHLPVTLLPAVTDEFARVTRGHLIVTVRSVGSPPTIFVDTLDKARRFRLDHDLDRCEIELQDGRQIAVSFHLFTAPELRSHFCGNFEIHDLCGLDIFHARFAGDARWNPDPSGMDPSLAHCLTRLEELYTRDASFIERATHLLLVGLRRPSGRLGLA